jgi:hypothetical protein
MKTEERITPGNRDDRIGGPFNIAIRATDPLKGITTADYLNALDCNVKGPLQRAFFELCDLLNELPKEAMETADDYLGIQRTAFMLWEQIDEKVMEDYRARRNV